MSILTLILAGGMGSGLGVLCESRSKAAVPFGGKYRIIDFAISNAVNSGLDRIAVLTQFQSNSIIEHLGNGEPWGLGTNDTSSLQTWEASIERTGLPSYRGTADAVYQNRKFILDTGCDQVLILAGDQIYKNDFRDMIHFHREKNAEVTILSAVVPAEEAHGFGIMETAPDNRIISFIEKPDRAAGQLASLGIYLFNTQYLLRVLEEDANDPGSKHDFGRNILPKAVMRDRAYAFSFSAQWMDVNTIEALWKANMALLPAGMSFIYDTPEWPICTRDLHQPPVLAGKNATILNSLISEGCIIEGQVSNSVLSPGVRVEKGAVVTSSVILHDCTIHAGAKVSQCILDNDVVIGDNARVGVGERSVVNEQEPARLGFEATVIGRETRIPENQVIGTNCKIGSKLTAEDFIDGHPVLSGQIIERKSSPAK